MFFKDKKQIGLLCVAALSVFLVACGENNEGVLAKINGQKLTTLAFDSYLKVKGSPVKDDKYRAKAFTHLVERESLATKVAKEGKLDTAVIDMEVAEFKRQLLISRYFEQYLKDNVSDVAVRNYYTSNPDKYQADQIHVAHILIRTNAKTSENERSALATRAGEAYSKIIQGEEFAKIAEIYSEDKVSGAKGGDLGWLSLGAIDPLFSEQAFSMSKGQVSKPFETPFGFHILTVLEDTKTVSTPFEKVKGNIRYQLRGEAKRAEKQRLISESEIKRFGEFKVKES